MGGEHDRDAQRRRRIEHAVGRQVRHWVVDEATHGGHRIKPFGLARATLDAIQQHCAGAHRFNHTLG
jgi:hypothetical protein